MSVTSEAINGPVCSYPGEYTSCQTTFLIHEPGWQAPAGWQPPPDAPILSDASDLIFPGDYTFAVAAIALNEATSPPRQVQADVLCLRGVSIPTEATMVSVRVTLAEAACSIDVLNLVPGSTATPFPECFTAGTTVDFTGPNYMPSIDSIGPSAETVFVGDFVDYSQSQWNTADGRQPPGEIKEGNAEIFTPITVSNTSAIRGDPGAIGRIVLNNYGKVDCSKWTTNQYPTFAAGRRYVFFVGSMFESGLRIGDAGLIVAWPIDSQNVVQTPADGDVPLDDLIGRLRS